MILELIIRIVIVVKVTYSKQRSINQNYFSVSVMFYPIFALVTSF